MSNELGLSVFRYPTTTHSRRHGPFGYDRYQSYKPWLRDEFAFRCVFCLIREKWYPNNAEAFGVDHLLPKSASKDLICDYDNLLYLCNRCNSAKQVSRVIDPCSEALANHLKIRDDGLLHALSKEGRYIIQTFNLNYSRVREYRRRKIEALAHWEAMGDEWSIQKELEYPDDLPDLSLLRCKNHKPEGVKDSFFERNRRGELDRTY